MKIIFRNDGLGLCRVVHNGVNVEFNFEYVESKFTLTEGSAVRAAHIGIWNRLEDTLNGSTEYLKEEENKSDQYKDIEEVRDSLNRWLEINK